jgi:hypothetical protein
VQRFPHPAHVPPRLSLLIALTLLIALAGCHVGSAEGADGTGGGTGGGPDSSSAPAADSGAAPEGDGGATGGGAVVPSDCADVTEPIAQAHDVGYDYDQGAGEGCLGMCHKDGANQGDTYTVAGALYDALGDGAQPIAGAHVFVTDSAGMVLDLVTSATGEFSSSAALTMPVQTLASGCPKQLKMISAATGNCNGGAACHTPTFKINLPP